MCQERCTHCLTESSPQKTHGTMTLPEWRTVIEDAAALEISKVQLIGGEPTLYPHWIELTDLALSLGLKVEIYSNLFLIRSAWWQVFERPGVSLATSYYSDDPKEHAQITKKFGSHHRTTANITEALRRNIPLRVGMVEVLPGQRIKEGRAKLAAMGVRQINTDRARAVGRAAESGAAPSVNELCGRCGHGRAAVLPDGQLALCVLSRFMPCANVKEKRLAAILDSPEWREAVARIPVRNSACTPNDSSDCDPSNTTACDPAYG
ncbi:radical SAM/SPASM domain-containing protein [Streptomyces sparsogenes]|uniref:radical SAM/SPASM domain-containing protein n=1 Tax=Streptomyces sparsogenes TaxID=67365 RepID=UPI0033E3F22D